MPEPLSGEALAIAFREYRAHSMGLPTLTGNGPNLNSPAELGLWGVFLMFVEENAEGLMMPVQLGSAFAVLGISASTGLLKDLLNWVTTTRNSASGEKKPLHDLSFRDFRGIVGVIQKLRFSHTSALTDDERAALKAAFVSVDVGGSGSILFSDLPAALAKCGLVTLGHEDAMDELAIMGDDDDDDLPSSADTVSVEKQGEGKSTTVAPPSPAHVMTTEDGYWRMGAESLKMQLQEFSEVVGPGLLGRQRVDEVLKRALRWKHRAIKDSARSQRTGLNVALKAFQNVTFTEEDFLPKQLGVDSLHLAAARLGECACASAGGRVEEEIPRTRENCLRTTQKIVDEELIVACRKQKKAGVEAALARGASPNARRTVLPKRSALLCACESGADVDCAQLLLSAGADLEAADEDGVIALMFAARGAVTSEASGLLLKLMGSDHVHEEEVEVVEVDKEAQDALASVADAVVVNSPSSRLIAGEEEVSVTKKFVTKQQTPAVVAKSREGTTALHYAAAFGRKMAARLLLEHAALPNALTKTKQTPLMLASKAGHIRCVELLLEHGADPDLKDRAKRTAVDYASRHEHSTVVEMLKKAAADKKSLAQQEAAAPKSKAVYFDDGNNPADSSHLRPPEPTTTKQPRPPPNAASAAGGRRKLNNTRIKPAS